MSRRRRPSYVLRFLLASVLSVSACYQGEGEPQPGDADDTTEPTQENQALEEPQAPELKGPAAPSSSSPPARTPVATADPPAHRPEASPPARSEVSDAGEPAAPPVPAEPEIIEVSVPAGSVLELELLTALDTSVNRVGDEIQARTISPLYVKGEPVLPQGSYVEGRVTAVQASGKVKGKASIGFTFDRLSTYSGIKKIQTSFVEKEAPSGKKKDATIIGGAAGVGAIVGGIIGGKKGAAIGATIGGAGGTGVVLTTKGEEIRIPVGSEINVRLDEAVVLQLN